MTKPAEKLTLSEAKRELQRSAKLKRRPRKKSGDVRYRDWLKDPF